MTISLTESQRQEIQKQVSELTEAAGLVSFTTEDCQHYTAIASTLEQKLNEYTELDLDQDGSKLLANVRDTLKLLNEQNKTRIANLEKMPAEDSIHHPPPPPPSSPIQKNSPTNQDDKFSLPAINIDNLLTNFKAHLLEKLSSKFHDKVEDIRATIAEKHEQGNTYEAFKAWFLEFMQTEEKGFEEDFSIWQDVIKPAVNCVAGIILSLLLTPMMMFSKSTTEWVAGFFKPEPKSNKLVHEEASQFVEAFDKAVAASTPTA